jgi:hypothetical protein
VFILAWETSKPGNSEEAESGYPYDTAATLISSELYFTSFHIVKMIKKKKRILWKFYIDSLLVQHIHPLSSILNLLFTFKTRKPCSASLGYSSASLIISFSSGAKG